MSNARFSVRTDETMNPIHFQLCNTCPDSWGYDFSCRRLFWLIDHFDSKYRSEMLLTLLTHFKTGRDDYDGDHWKDEWYQDFKKCFVKANAECQKEDFVVFGLLTYVLAKAVQKSNACRFKHLVEEHERHIADMQAYLAAGEPPLDAEGTVVIDAASAIEETKQKPLSLYKEIEFCKEAYDAFCEQVVKPMLEKREEPLHESPGPPPSRN